MRKLALDKAFRDYFVGGLDLDGEKEADYFEDGRSAEIEARLKHHFWIAVHQLLRASVCVPCMGASFPEKQRIVEQIFEEYNNAVEFVNAWPTKKMEKMFDQSFDYSEIAQELGTLFGVPLDEDHERLLRE